MKIAHPELSSPIKFEESLINMLVIENSAFFYSAVSDIYNQINHTAGKFALSRNNTLLDFSEEAELITQFVPFELNKRSLVTKLYSKIKDISISPEFYIRTAEMSGEICRYFRTLAQELDNDINFDCDVDINGLCKAMSLRFNEDCESLSEKIAEYILNVRQFEKKNLFILVNFRDYVNTLEIEQFYKTMVGHKFNILLIESHEHDILPLEKRIIIDNDMCEIC